MIAGLLLLLGQASNSERQGAVEGLISVEIVSDPHPRAKLFLGGIKKGQHILTLSESPDPMGGFWPVGRRPTQSVRSTNNTITWRQSIPGRTLTRTFTVHRTASRVHVRTETEFDREGTVTGPLLSQYRFTASTSPLQSYFPASPSASVLTDDRFLAPVAAVAGGGSRAIVIPDLDILATSRPMPATLYGSGDSINYGFHTGVQRTRAGVYEVSDFSATRRMPEAVTWGETIVLSRPPASSPVTAGLSSLIWELYGRPRLLRSAFPQEAPFLYYTKPTYDFPVSAAESEAMPEAERKGARQWWEQDLNGRTVGAPSGQEVIRWGVLDNSLRAAWGMKWWSRTMKQAEWSRKSEAMLNLALSAPGDTQGFSTSLSRKSSTWGEARSLPEMAETGRWYIRWLDDFADLPQQKEIVARVTALAKYCIGQMRPDGTFRGQGGAAIVVPQVTSFLVAVAMSPAIENQSLKALAKEAVRSATQLERLGESLSVNPEPGSGALVALPTAHALMMKSRVTQDPSSVALAGKVLRRLALEQSVWSMPYRPGKDTFGSLPSAGQFDLTSTHAAMVFIAVGAASGDRELMERGTAAMRSPLDAGMGPTFGTEPAARSMTGFLGRMAGGFGISETDRFDPWPGFEYGEGQVLATLADVSAQYGDFYRHRAGWGVGFNGLSSIGAGEPTNILTANDPPYSKGFPITIVDDKKARTTLDTVSSPRQIRRLIFDPRPEGVFLIAEPTFSSSTAYLGSTEAEFAYANGKTTVAKVGARGWEAIADRSSVMSGPVSFRAILGGDTIVSAPADLFLRPILRTSAQAPRGWRRTKDLADTGFPSDWLMSLPWLSTADDGSGASRPSLRGEIHSVEFLVTEPALRMEIRGTAGASIELIDSDTGEALESYESGSGQKPETLEWELAPHQGRTVTIRLIDNSAEAWIAATGFEFLTSSTSADIGSRPGRANLRRPRPRSAEPRRR